MEDKIHLIKRLQKVDVQKLMHLLNTTYGLEAQVKIIKVLAAYIAYKNECLDVIIKNKHLYDKLIKVLRSKHPYKVQITVHFITALLYNNNNEDLKIGAVKKSLAIYGRNMIRASGCLDELMEIFTANMLNQDTWKALCKCLAETCRNSEANQNYCSHLVPWCIIKCKHGQIEVISVMQSLLQHNKRNILSFLDNDGISLFTREILQYECCMELLSTVVEDSSEAVQALHNTDVPDLLNDILITCGTHAIISQWATIVLYHLQKYLQINDFKLKKSISDKGDLSLTNAHEASIQNATNETENLFQNVVNELFRWKIVDTPGYMARRNTNCSRNTGKQRNISTMNDKQKPLSRVYDKPKPLSRVYDKPKPIITKRNINISASASFSFLLNQEQAGDILKNTTDEKKDFSNFSGENETISCIESLAVTNDRRKYFYGNSFNLRQSNDSLNLNNFKPKFISTPKRNKISNQTKDETRNISHQKLVQIRRKHRKISNTSLKNQTMSARLFSAINNSCTTLIKTIKTIFTTKESNKREIEISSTSNLKESYNSSKHFETDEYLSQRNVAGAKTDETGNFMHSINLNACKTCNDTMALKRKQIDDKHLKDTLKKLKLGINLYGCDFKVLNYFNYSNYAS